MLLIHDGWENISNQFPVAMIRHRFTSNRKPYANSFLPSCFDIVSCRIGNYTRKVSCRDETLLSHAGWEKLRKQFAADLSPIVATPPCHFERSEAESRNLRSNCALWQ